MNDPFRNPDLSDRFQACMGAKQHLSTHRDSETYWLLTQQDFNHQQYLVVFFRGFPRFKGVPTDVYRVQLTEDMTRLSPLKMEG